MTLTALGRFLSHWSFWPVWVSVVTLLLGVLQPWQKWIDRGAERHSIDGIRVHATFPDEHVDTFGIGRIVIVAGTPAPASDWLPCDGRELRRADHAELFARTGERFGGDATHFRLPDYRGLAWRSFDDAIATMSIKDSLVLASPGATDDPLHPERPLAFWIRVR
jgi:hypothetical protein